MKSPAKIFAIAALACAAMTHGGLASAGSLAASGTLFDATFTDGTAITGSFRLNVYGYLDDTSVNVTTRAYGNFTGATYTFGGVFGAPPSNVIDLTFGTDSASHRDLHIVLQQPMNLAAYDAIDLAASYECQTYDCANPANVRYFASGAVVPEPATWLLMALGGAALWQRKEWRSGQAIAA